MLLPRTPATRWEAPPATPRAVIACEEVKKLVESRLEKDGAMARRIRDAELRCDPLRTHLTCAEKRREGATVVLAMTLFAIICNRICAVLVVRNDM